MTTALTALAYVLLALIASPLLEGIVRKIKALIHSRKGPPITQPYLDLIKLFVKEDLSSVASPVVRFAPHVAFASVLAALFFVPMGTGAPAGQSGDLFVLVYLITLGDVAVMAGALAQKSPFAHVGASREMMMTLTTEAVILLSLLVVAIAGRTAMPSALVAHSFSWSYLLAIFCFLFAMQAMLGKLPFDAPEAEQEIMEGPFIEYSGSSLALFKWTFYVKQLLLGSLLVNLFIPLPAFGAIAGFAVSFLAVVVLSLFVVLVDATNPRLRVDQSLRFFGGLIGVGLVAVGLAAAGL